MLQEAQIQLKVWGDYACFTRPELKVERMSYPVMTPSAARGVLEAILWKPQMRWRIKQITVLKPSKDYKGPPYQLMGVRRNEVQDKIAPRTVSTWMADPTSYEPFYVDSAGREGIQGQRRTQRNTLALRDVCYLIDAGVELTKMANQPRHKPPIDEENDGPDSISKYVGMFERRAAKGQCHHHPYLGCREFAANFEPPNGDEEPMDWNEDLGFMLYDMKYRSNGSHLPGFFLAKIRQGALHCDTLANSVTGEPPIQILGWSSCREED